MNARVFILGALFAVGSAPFSRTVMGTVFNYPLGGGWQASVVDNNSVSIVVDEVTSDHVTIQISADFVDPPDPVGIFSPLYIDFQQIDENAVPRIIINDEAITNQTGSDWSDFRWVILSVGDAWFNETESAALTVDPFLTKTFGHDIGANMPTDLVADGGTLPSFGATFFPGGSADPNDQLVIDVNVGTLANPTLFTLKQFPGNPSTAPCYGDFDSDGDVDFADFVMFTQHFSGSNQNTDDPTYDSDSDGDCDLDDFARFSNNYTGSGYPC